MLASRKELVEYDRQQQEAAQSAAIPLSASSTPSTPTLSPRASELFVTAVELKPGMSKPREKLVFPCVSVICIKLKGKRQKADRGGHGSMISGNGQC